MYRWGYSSRIGMSIELAERENQKHMSLVGSIQVLAGVDRASALCHCQQNSVLISGIILIMSKDRGRGFPSA